MASRAPSQRSAFLASFGAVGFGAAATTVTDRLSQMPRIAELRGRIEAVLRASGASINGASRSRVSTACHASIEGVHGHELVAALDLEGVEVSSGAACSSGKADPSESISRLYPDEPWRARSALRVTLGPETTSDEVERACETFAEVIARVRG